MVDMVIDFNNIAYRSMFICTYSSEYSVNDFSTERECGVLVRKIVIDMCNVIRTFKPDRVFVACDSKNPWRKSVFDDYKGTREKDATKDWDMIYKSFDNLKGILSSYGICVIDISGSEADDVAGMCKQKFYTEGGDDLILVSADKDWTQLVSFNNDTNKFCICYNPIPSRVKGKNGRRIISATSDFVKWFENNTVTDIFFTNYSFSKETIKMAMSSNTDICIEEIDPSRVLFEKVMCGDDGDNVPAFYSYYKNGRKVRVTPSKSEIVFQKIGSSDMNKVSEACISGMLKESMVAAMKVEIDDIDFAERLNMQRLLVELDPSLFPSNIRYEFDMAVSKEDCGMLKNKDVKMTDILTGTEYLKEDNLSKPKLSSIFGDIVDSLDNLEKHIKRNM